MKNAVIITLIAIIGVGAAVVYANPRTVETEAAVEVRVWRNVVDPSRIHLSTRPAEGRWTTHEDRLVFERSDSGNWDQSDFVTVSVPITVEYPMTRSSSTMPDPTGRKLYGEGEECLTTTGCGFGYFDVPSGVLLIVGVDIAPGTWNSSYEGPGDSSCYAQRLSRGVLALYGEDDRVSEVHSEALISALSLHPDMIVASWLDLFTEQPSGRYAWHSSVIEEKSTDYVYGPQRFSLEVAPTDYAVLINGACK